MTATAAAVRLCACGHVERRHSVGYGCDNTDCGCTAYRAAAAGVLTANPLPDPSPVAVPTSPRGTATVPPEPSVDQIVAAGRRSASKRTVSLAERVAGLAGELRTRLVEERVAAEAKRRRYAEAEAAQREVAELEKRLAAARAKLRNGRTPPSTKSTPKSTGDGICPACGKDGLSNVGAHRFRAHGHREAG